jgi:hypothetical protein
LTIEETVNDIVASDSAEKPIIEETVEWVKTEFNCFDDYANVLTKTELTAIFGKAALKDVVAWYAEGTVEKETTILNDAINGYELTYVWNDDNDSLAWISADYNLWDGHEISGHQSLITKSGLRLGMTLNEIQDWNEVSFEFSGFGWDYAGGVYREEGTKLYETGFVLTLGEGDNLDYEKFGFILGDTGLKSDDDKLNGAGIHLYSITKYMKG